MGYTIPKNVQILVNAWAIGRDSSCWEDPLLFKPERFLSTTVDFKVMILNLYHLDLEGGFVQGCL